MAYNVTAITSGENQFYPTPKELAQRMLANIDWNKVNTVLEPSAGKGDLVEVVGELAYGNQK